MFVRIESILQEIASEVPNGSSVYLFGSAARGGEYNDIDLLILYNPECCLPRLAYLEHRAFVDKVTKALNTPVHLLLLTYAEEKSIRFIDRVSAIRIPHLPEGARHAMEGTRLASLY